MLKNPYKNINWSSVKRTQGNTHNHLFLQWHIDNMYEHGGRFIGCHPHWGEVLYPVSERGLSIPEDAIEYALTEHYGNNTYKHPNHFSGIGCTLSSDTEEPHSGYNGTAEEFLDAIRDNLQVADGGGVHQCHPGTLIPVPGNPIFEGMKKMYDYAPDIFLGLEFYNNSQGKTYAGKSPWMFGYWDELLKTGRQVWGFANPDYEARILTPYPDWEGKMILLTNEVTRDNCLRAIRNGEFIPCLHNSGFTFTNIQSSENTVYIELSGVGDVEFVTATRRVLFEGVSNAHLDVVSDDIYVRVEGKQLEEQIFSQPLMFVEDTIPEIPLEPIPVQNKRLVSNRSILI